MAIPAPYEHQKITVEKLLSSLRVFDLSDPGTGKTRAHIDGFADRPGRRRGLVLAPKSILRVAWGNDIEAFRPELSYSICTAPKRAQAFLQDTDLVITNHDTVKWLVQNPGYLSDFSDLIVDESSAFKNRTTQRSQAIRELTRYFEAIRLLTGTPNSRTITDIWHQAFLLDRGERLGSNFFQFRNSVCTPVQNGPRAEHIQWEDKPGAEDAVADLLSDITVRHQFERCSDIPENVTRNITFQLSPQHQSRYNRLRNDAVLELQDNDVSAIHAASLRAKLLQLTSGAVYDDNGDAALINTDRYELVMELAQQRHQCVIAFNWTHQRDQLARIAERLNMPYSVIDGSVNDDGRERAVNRFQEGLDKIILIHPQSGAHGLTLTRGTTTIWPSPTYNAEHFLQLNRRIYRAGQQHKTETLCVVAENTVEEGIYAQLQGKLDRMNSLLDILTHEGQLNAA